MARRGGHAQGQLVELELQGPTAVSTRQSAQGHPADHSCRRQLASRGHKILTNCQLAGLGSSGQGGNGCALRRTARQR